MTGDVRISLRALAAAALGCLPLAALAQEAAPVPAPAAAAGAGLTGPGDVLRLRVLDWDGVAGALREWPEISGDYVIGPDGAIAVPFAGRVAAGGRGSDAVAADVAEGLRYRLALVERPEASVEVAAWRPVTVTGAVAAPGPVAFAPGLLAAQAVALAGGAGSRLAAEGEAEREALAAQAALVALRGTERRLMARLARLDAERAGQDRIDRASSPLADAPRGPEWRAVLDAEDQLLAVRQSQLARSLAAIDAQAALSEAEIESLTGKAAALERQRGLAREAAASVGDLAERGLVANQRVLESESLFAGLESQILDVSTAVLEARQDVAAAERERSGLADARSAEILEAAQAAEAQLAETRARIDGQRALLDALGLGEAAGPGGIGAPGGEARIAVLRPVPGGGLERIEDAALEPLRPGDMVEVGPAPPGPGPADAALAAAPAAAPTPETLPGAAARSSSGPTR